MARVQRDHNDLFVYQNQAASESAFEVFLRNTTEKAALASYIASKIEEINRPSPGLSILDVGCGDASLLTLTGKQTSRPFFYTGIEPVPQLCQQAIQNISQTTSSFIVLNEPYGLTALAPNSQDLIVASNLYHLHIEEVPLFLLSLKSLLKPGGCILFVYRSGESDGITQFRLRFESLFYEDYRLPRNANDILNICEAGGITGLGPETISSKVIFPEGEDTDRIIEFIMNMDISNIPQPMRSEMEEFLVMHGRELISSQAVFVLKKD